VILKGELIIDPGLPEKLSQGLFAASGRHDVYIRMSTNAGDILPDDIGSPRPRPQSRRGRWRAVARCRRRDPRLRHGQLAGILGTNSRQILGQSQTSRQNDRPSRGNETSGVSALAANKCHASGGRDPEHRSQLARRSLQCRPARRAVLKHHQFPLRDKHRKILPRARLQRLKDLTGQIIDASDRPDAIRDMVRQEMAAIDRSWEFRVQLCRDLGKQPIEDPTIS
jgi:hypothetical protein